MTNIIIKNENYQLRFTTKSCINAEARLGKNPINVFIECANTGGLPKLTDVLIIFHECLLPLNHGIKMDDVIDLYDAYLEEGNSIMDMLNLLLRVLQDCGFVPKDKEEVKN